MSAEHYDGHDYDYEHGLESAIRRVKDLHARKTHHYAGQPEVEVCEHCTSGGDPFMYPDGADGWPCPTIAALMDVEV